MKLLKLYSVFAILVLTAVVVAWVLGALSSEESFELMKKAGALIGVLFVTTFILQTLTKPKTPTR